MSHTWELFGLIVALIFWGGLGIMIFAPQLKKQLAAVSAHARTTPVRTMLGALAVGIAIIYGETKPPEVKEVEFSYNKIGDTATLIGIKQYPTDKCLTIPETYSNLTVTAIAANFCTGVTYFTSVSLPKTVTKIGAGFFGYGTDEAITLSNVTAVANSVYAVNAEDKVLYEIGTTNVVYAWGSIKVVRYRVDFDGTSFFTNKVHDVDLVLPGKLRDMTILTQIGWATNENAEEIEYEFGSSYTNNAAITFYPVWATRKLNLHLLNGAEMTTSLTYSAGIKLPVYSRPGYTLAGWAEAKYAGKKYENEATPPSSDCEPELDLYAIWVTTGGYGLAFDPNYLGSEWTMPYQSIGLGKVAKLNPCKLTPPTGKKFGGWLIADGDKQNRRLDDEVLVFNLANKTNEIIWLKAIWETK